MVKNRLLSLTLVAACSLAACGGGSSSSSTDESNTPSSTTGVLVDDLIIGGTVFCDVNNNGVLDSGEASATTAADGSYTFSQACSAPIVSVASTGYDKTSLKAPKGSLRARAGSAVVSPFTTMLAESGLSLADFKAVMVKLGLGDIDPASFDPTKDAAKLQTATAVAKILNDIAAIVAAAGGDPQAAFAAAAKELANSVKSPSRGSSASIFDDDSVLGDLIDKASTKGFDSVSTSTWSTEAKAVARSIAKEGIKTVVKSIKNASSASEMEDAFRNEGTANLLAQTDLSDSTAVTDAISKCKDSGNFAKAQYVYSPGNDLRLIGASSTGYSCGSYSRSASWMITTSPVAAAMPVRRAAPLPMFFSWRMILSTKGAISLARMSRVPSLEKSSTMMISFSGTGELRTRSTMVRIVLASL